MINMQLNNPVVNFIVQEFSMEARKSDLLHMVTYIWLHYK